METRHCYGGLKRIALVLMTVFSCGAPRHVVADDPQPGASASYVDVSTLPHLEGGQSLASFLPQEGRFVMKVKRGWEGLLYVAVEKKVGGREWHLVESNGVGCRRDASLGKEEQMFFPSLDPVLEAAFVDEVSKFAAVRKGVATLRYVSALDKESSKMIKCELRIEVESDTSELDAAIREACPKAIVKATEVRWAAFLTGTVPTQDDIGLINAVAEQFYPQVISKLKVADAPDEQKRDRASSPDAPVSSKSNLMPSSDKSVRKSRSQDQLNELHALREDVRGLREEVRRLTNLISTKRKSSDPLNLAPQIRKDLSDAGCQMLIFTATWCTPCQKMQPIINSLKRQGYGLRIVDVDQESSLVRNFDVETVPQFIVVSHGEAIERISGLTTEEKLKALLKKYDLGPTNAQRQIDDNSAIDPEAERIRGALQQEIACAFDNTPLTDVIKQIQKQLNINIVMDVRALEEEGISATAPVTIEVSGISARSALQLILQPLNLAVVIGDEVLKVTSRQRSKGDMIVISYPLGDLLDNLKNPSPIKPDDEIRSKSLLQIVEIIRGTIEPETWDEVGGPAAIKIHEQTRCLLVRQTSDVHVKIRKLLDEIRGTRTLPRMQSSRGKYLSTVPEPTGPDLKVVTYSVADLLIPAPNQDGKVRQPDHSDWLRLTESITTTIEPECWSGGPCSIRGHEQTLSLVIRAPDSVQDRVAKLLERNRQRLDLNLDFEVKSFETSEEGNVESLGITFDPMLKTARLDGKTVTSVLKTVTDNGGEIVTIPKITVSNGNVACIKRTNDENGLPVRNLYLRGSVVANSNSIRINTAFRSHSILQDLISHSFKIDDGGYLLFDATEQAQREIPKLAPGRRVYMLVQTRMLKTAEEPLSP